MKRIKEYIQNNVVSVLSDMIRIYSPYFHEEKIADYIYKRMRGNFRSFVQNYHKKEKDGIDFHGKNIICDFGNFENGFVVFNGHMDTVIKTEGWDSDPLEPVINGDLLYGLGSLDMKGGLCAIILAMEALKSCSIYPSTGVRFIAVSDEEGPLSLGSYYSMKEGLYEGAKGIIIAEGVAPFSNKEVEFPSIAIGARGRYLQKFNIKGQSAHGASPESGINAIELSCELISKLKEIPLNSHKFMGSESMCILKIEGGQKTLSVPDKCEIYLDRHVVEGTNEKEITASILKAVKDSGFGSRISFSIEEKLEDGVVYKPYLLNEENFFLKEFSDILKSSLGKEPQLTSFKSICDMNLLGPRLSAPVLIFGPDGGNPHRENEFVKISSVIDTSIALASLIS